jgi:hypothetical protein
LSSLKVLPVWRYRQSGKLVVFAGNGQVFGLDSTLHFTSEPPHRVGRRVRLEQTSYRVEVETRQNGEQRRFVIVRRWDENHLPTKSTDPNALLEARVDISPSEEFNESEHQYTGRKGPHASGYWFLAGTVLSPIVALMAQSWWILLLCPLSFVAGYFVTKLTGIPGDPLKTEEVRLAKARVREGLRQRLEAARRDMRVWAALDGVGFERALAGVFREKGFEVALTPGSNDKGIDLVLTKHGAITLVQCKAYAGTVGVAAVRELIGVRTTRPDAASVMLAAINGFSAGARTLAGQHAIQLYSIAEDYLKVERASER